MLEIEKKLLAIYAELKELEEGQKIVEGDTIQEAMRKFRFTSAVKLVVDAAEILHSARE